MVCVDIPDESVEAVARRNFEAEHGAGEWERCPEDAKPGWLEEARGMPAKWAERVDRAANDPQRIERRKRIAPSFTVPRQRP